jgi:hypothetical protein
VVVCISAGRGLCRWMRYPDGGGPILAVPGQDRAGAHAGRELFAISVAPSQATKRLRIRSGQSPATR